MHMKMDNVILQPDPVNGMAVKLRLDVLNFSIDQLEY